MTAFPWIRIKLKDYFRSVTVVIVLEDVARLPFVFLMTEHHFARFMCGAGTIRRSPQALEFDE